MTELTERLDIFREQASALLGAKGFTDLADDLEPFELCHVQLL